MSLPISHEAREIHVLNKTRFFTQVQLWPLHSKMNVNGWLSNFSVAEKPYAIAILNSMIYYPDNLMRSMLKSTFQSLSSDIIEFTDLANCHSRWRQFVDAATFLHVTGEEPSNTDSGYVFLRMARQVLELTDEKFPNAAEVLLELSQGRSRTVVFVDDFVGSGNQFCETWNRLVELPDGSETCFADFALDSSNRFFYCPLVCTEFGAGRIREECIGVNLVPTHILVDKYSIFASESYIWPSDLAKNAIQIIREASLRIGLQETGGASVTDWQGYRQLGLVLAFEHSVPDATIPLIYWDRNGWKPLVPRK